jgi:hypothetical protein
MRSDAVVYPSGTAWTKYAPEHWLTYWELGQKGV